MAEQDLAHKFETLKIEARRLRAENEILRKEAALDERRIATLRAERDAAKENQCSDTCEFYYA